MMIVIVIDFNTGHMAMITMVMHSNNNRVAMIVMVVDFRHGAAIGPSSAISCFLIVQAST
jgi:hypothetical protein